jgi:hypothetical protein
MGSFEEALDQVATTLRGSGRWCMFIHWVIDGCGDAVVAVRAMAALAQVPGAHISHVGSGAVHPDKSLRPGPHKIVQAMEGTMKSPVRL